MKVLFAVSNDNITTSVVGKYQQKYKEIITSKNVYYFNAIIKELQKDKTYDAIVIGEDLEPISNSNYEAIDKFLLEKLDSISDEASKPTGEDIPIIFICSDRRTKSDQLLRKLFSMSIYNALVGNDRSIEIVCALLNKPRNKKEAKKYYQLDTDNVDYEPGNSEDVSEAQIQNILSYYKKIGLNEKKCVQAFESISKQYDSTQLRIIAKFLPINVKAILEANCAEYQKLMMNGTVLSNGKYNSYKPNNEKKPGKLDFLEKDLEKTNLTKPVVIPSTIKVNSNLIKKNQVQNSNAMQYNQGQAQNTNNLMQYNQVQKSNNPMQYNQAQNENNSMQYNQGQNNNQMQYNSIQNYNNTNSDNGEEKKLQENNYNESIINGENTEPKSVQPMPVQAVKRGRGRPKKIENIENEDMQINNIATEEQTIETPQNMVSRKGRGRPKKIDAEIKPLEQENTQGISNFEQTTNLEPASNFEQPEKEEDTPLDLFNLDIEKENIEPSMTLPGLEENNNYNPYNNAYGMMNDFNNNVQPNIQTQEQVNPYSEVDQMSQINPINQVNPMSQVKPMSQVNSMNQVNPMNQANPINTINPTNLTNNISNNVIAGAGKIAAFVGTTKNGTSFIVNNLAQLLSQNGIKTAVIDLTKNKNAYYMFTDNDPQLMQIATDSLRNLSQGIVKGIEVNKNLTVFTALPDEMEEEQNPENIIQNLSSNFEIALLDCDFTTAPNYFVKANEIYLVQTMDAFTIQPLTEFLSNLKLKGLLDEKKLRVVINKYMRLKRLDDRMIIGGMSKYNEPSMTLQRDLFNPNEIKHINIPFEEQSYALYLESIAMCQLSLNGYSQNFLANLEQLKNMVYPLIAGNNNANNNTGNGLGKYSNNKKSLFGSKKDSTKFSNNVNDTLNKMRLNNY